MTSEELLDIEWDHFEGLHDNGCPPECSQRED